MGTNPNIIHYLPKPPQTGLLVQPKHLGRTGYDRNTIDVTVCVSDKGRNGGGNEGLPFNVDMKGIDKTKAGIRGQRVVS